jgi:hypothetical protein
MLSAIESHVLDHVGHALLIVVFENRTRLHDQTQLGALLRFLVGANIVGHAVRELAGRDLRIGRHVVGQRLRPNDSCLSAGQRKRQQQGRENEIAN